MCKGLGSSFYYSVYIVFQEFIEAFGQMGRTFFQAERIVDGRTLHQRKGISRTSSVPGPVSVHVSTVNTFKTISDSRKFCEL